VSQFFRLVADSRYGGVVYRSGDSNAPKRNGRKNGSRTRYRRHVGTPALYRRAWWMGRFRRPPHRGKKGAMPRGVTKCSRSRRRNTLGQWGQITVSPETSDELQGFSVGVFRWKRMSSVWQVRHKRFRLPQRAGVQTHFHPNHCRNASPAAR